MSCDGGSPSQFQVSTLLALPELHFSDDLEQLFHYAL